MPRPQHNTTSLPRGLRDELGIRDTYGDKKRQRNGPANRKERRQAERNNKKSGRPAAAPVKKSFQRRPQPKEEEDDDEEEDDLDLNEESSSDESPAVPNSKRTSIQKPDSEQKSVASTKPKRPLTISEEAQSDSSQYEGESGNDESYDDSDHESLAARGAHISENVKSKLAQDDAEIAALEKKLGLKKGKKLPKAFAEDGLEDLMGDLGEASEDDSKKRKREADEWLQSKRQKALQRQAQADNEEEDEDEEEGDFDSDEDMDNLDEEIFGSESDEDGAEDSEFDGFDKEEEAPKKRENPYVAPVPKTETAASQKYIPPSLRARGDPESEALTRLRRQAQGHLNKLSEANLVSILAEFEKLYRDHPRQNVTSTLISLLMGLIGERSVLNDTFIVLHAGFIAAVYKIMGMDFGAEIVQKIVETMDAGGDERGKFEGKEYINLVSLLCQLYNFHVIGHPLMFDYIRLFLQEITETNTELLLKIIRSKCFPILC